VPDENAGVRGVIRSTDTNWGLVMGEEEFEHFGYLLRKVVNQYRQGDEPSDEVFPPMMITDIC
jgi:hypothetical protein